MGGLRERKRADSRSATVDAGFRLFAERGYDDVTVAEICAAADIGRRTFFRYFATKDDLLLEPVREMTEQVSAGIAASPAAATDAEALRGALTALAESLLGDRERLVRVRQVLPTTLGARSSSYTVLSEQEARVAGELLARRGADGPPDWRLRLVVARATAAFRVWLDDFVAGGLADPRAHLTEILDAPLDLDTRMNPGAESTG